MANRRRGNYPYSIERSFPQAAARRSPPKKKKRRPLRVVVMVILLVLIGGASVLVFRSEAPHSLTSFMPFPKKLVALRFTHNSKEVILMPGSQGVLNPRDSLQLLEVQTDGWLSWGTRVESPDLDVARMRKAPVTIKELMPRESFEIPRTIEIKTLSWGQTLVMFPFWSGLTPRTGCKRPMRHPMWIRRSVSWKKP